MPITREWLGQDHPLKRIMFCVLCKQIIGICTDSEIVSRISVKTCMQTVNIMFYMVLLNSFLNQIPATKVVKTLKVLQTWL